MSETLAWSTLRPHRFVTAVRRGRWQVRWMIGTIRSGVGTISRPLDRRQLRRALRRPPVYAASTVSVATWSRKESPNV
jgi:hypothetical protein